MNFTGFFAQLIRSTNRYGENTTYLDIDGRFFQHNRPVSDQWLRDVYWPIVAICQSGQVQRNEEKPDSLAGIGGQHF
jgi:hypothetical protein